MTTLTAPAVGQKVMLPNVDWRTYKRMLLALAEYPGLRITYDRGMLEIMTKSPQHERFTHLLGRLVQAISDELGIDIAGFGGMTMFRPRTRGLEPDACYYIANAASVDGKDAPDLRSDPPPDLVLEVDIASSSVDRLAIYAAFGVPEIWIHENAMVTFQILQTNQTYQPGAVSLAFPWLTPADLVSFLALRPQFNERVIIARFRAWVRQQAGGGPAIPTP